MRYCFLKKFPKIFLYASIAFIPAFAFSQETGHLSHNEASVDNLASSSTLKYQDKSYNDGIFTPVQLTTINNRYIDTVPVRLKKDFSRTFAASSNGWGGFRLGNKGFYALPFYQNERGFYLELGYRKEKVLLSTDSLNWTQSIAGIYSITNNSLGAVYYGKFNHLIGSWNLLLNASFDQKLKNYFWGLGNETPFSQTVEYYRLFTQEGHVDVGFNRLFSKYNSITLSGFYESIKVKEDENHLVYDKLSSADPTVFNAKNFIGAQASYSYYNVNDLVVPTKGFGGTLNASYTKNVSQTDRSFERYWSTLGFYIPIGGAFSFASKNGAATLSGKPEFYQYNEIGGGPNLRGVHRDRFYGKSSFYNDNELRWIHDVNTTSITGKIGLIAFIDDGRVWMPNEISNKWHLGYGGGVLLVPFNKIAASIYYGVSDDDKLFHLRLGRFF